ncbi:hypothetical protein G9A89_004629 [Geosiphon pyriformis]|nr:hypothetical protein G9A89_004629 [Geosiphon pyriformis]
MIQSPQKPPTRRLSIVSNSSSNTSVSAQSRHRFPTSPSTALDSKSGSVSDQLWLQAPTRPLMISQQQLYSQAQFSSQRAVASPHRKNTNLGKKCREDRTDPTKSLEISDFNAQDQKSAQISSSQQIKSSTKFNEDSKEETAEGNLSRQTKNQSKRFKEAQAEVMKTFNELQVYEVRLASQTNQTLARLNSLFNSGQNQSTQENDSEEEAFGTIEDNRSSSKNNSLIKASLVLTDNKGRRSTSSAKKNIPSTNPTTSGGKTLLRRNSALVINQPTTTSGLTHPQSNQTGAENSSRRRTNTTDGTSFLRSSSFGHNRYASESSGIGLAVTTNTRVDMAEKKSIKESRSEEMLRQLMQLHDSQKKKEKKRATMDPTLGFKSRGNDSFSLEEYSNSSLKRRTFESTSAQSRSLPKSSLLSNNSYDEDNLSREDTPSPLLPGISRSKTMPIPVPNGHSISSINSRLPPPTAVRNHSSTGHFPNLSKNNNLSKLSDHDLTMKNIPDLGILSTSAPKDTKRRKSIVTSFTQSSNSSSTSSQKATSRTTTPTSLANHRLSHPPPVKFAQPPPPVPSMPPSLLPLPQTRPRSQQKLHKVNEEIPPVPALPASIMKETITNNNNSHPEKKTVLISETAKSADGNAIKGKREKGLESRSSSSASGKKPPGRKRGTTLPNNITSPPVLKPNQLPPFNVPTLPASVNRISAPVRCAKTPTALESKNSTRLTTPTSVNAPSFTKIPTPTGIPTRTLKSSNGISSPSGLRGVLTSGTRTSQVSPQKLNIDILKPGRTNGGVPNGRKSATTPNQILSAAKQSTKKANSLNLLTSITSSPATSNSTSTEKAQFRPRRLSNTITSIFNKPIVSIKKPRTISGPAASNPAAFFNTPMTAKLRLNLPNDSSISVSSSSSASTPNGYKLGDGENSGEEEMTYLLQQQEKKEKERKEREKERKEREAQTKGTSPITPQSALKTYSPYLSLYERTEIVDYPNVYFIGPNAQKKAASPELTGCNSGFDDERGDYHIVTGDHLCYRYEIMDSLGKGSFGQVLKCHDHKTGEIVAVKIIRNKKRFHCQALVEVKILESLNKWDPDDSHNIIHLTDHFYFRNHLCIAFELLSINLYEFIKKNNFNGFSLSLVRRFCTQLLNSLSLLQKHNIVHCDLKPENILLKHPTKSSIKVIDFGSSCFENEKVYTYIQSRFYRSPEVILGMTYNMSIDMWSLGCILAELFTGYPLFPGENEQEQLACIMEVIGLPDKYLVEKSTRKKLFFDSGGNPRLVTNSKGKRRRPGSKPLSQIIKTNDVRFIEFIARCLEWDPEKRIKPDEGLIHEWITEVKINPKNLTTPTSGEFTAKTTYTSSSSRSSQYNTSQSQYGTSIPKSMTQPISTLNFAQLHLAPNFTPSRRSLDAGSQASTTRATSGRQFVNSVASSSTNGVNTKGYAP